MATKTKRIKRCILFTDEIRRELCGGDTYWLATTLPISITETVNHDWDGDRGPFRPPTLHKVVASLVEEAYRKGKQEGREEIQKGIKDLLDICDEADDYI